MNIELPENSGTVPSLSARAPPVDLVRSSLAESGFLVRDNAQVMRVNEAEMGGQIQRRQMGNK